MALVTESAATSRSLRRLFTLLTVLVPAPVCPVKACFTSPPRPARESPVIATALRVLGGGMGGE